MGKDKTIVRYGSKGAGVTDLQKALNTTGYNLQEDGVFGKDTLAAVKDYQKDNALAVDGVVGNKTWTSLSGGTNAAANSSGSTNKTANNSASNKFTYDDFSYGDYVESDTVRAAGEALNATQAARPGAYSSKWQAQINDIISRIGNREDFSYDVNGDALYQQYKDQYIQAGKMAMQDTMGQAAAMTGGYGNSYAAAVGNQAYQGYLQQLNDKVPELAQMAYDRYRQEGQDMLNLYSLYSDQENSDYGRYRDSVSDYLTERDYATGRYDAERSFDYSKYADDRNFDYGVYADDRNLAYNDYRNSIADEQWQTQFDESVRQYNEQFEYGKERDSIADEQWQASYDESKRQFDESMSFSKQQYEDGKKQAEATGNSSAVLEHVSSISSAELVSTLKEYNEDGDNDGLASFLDDCVASGRLTEEQADNYYAKYRKSDTKKTDTTVTPNPDPTGTPKRGSMWERPNPYKYMIN